MFDETVFLPADENSADISFATVAGVSQDGVALRLDGEKASGGKAYRRLASYMPSEGDRVFVLRAGKELIVAGKIV